MFFSFSVIKIVSRVCCGPVRQEILSPEILLNNEPWTLFFLIASFFEPTSFTTCYFLIGDRLWGQISRWKLEPVSIEKSEYQITLSSTCSVKSLEVEHDK